MNGVCLLPLQEGRKCEVCRKPAPLKCGKCKEVRRSESLLLDAHVMIVSKMTISLASLQSCMSSDGPQLPCTPPQPVHGLVNNIFMGLLLVLLAGWVVVKPTVSGGICMSDAEIHHLSFCQVQPAICRPCSWQYHAAIAICSCRYPTAAPSVNLGTGKLATNRSVDCDRCHAGFITAVVL